MAPQANEGMMAKVVGGGVSSYAGVDSVLQILTSNGLHATIAGSNNTAAAAVALLVLVLAMVYIATIAGVVQFSSPR